MSLLCLYGLFQGATIVDQPVTIALAPEYELPAAAASALPTVILSSKAIFNIIDNDLS